MLALHPGTPASQRSHIFSTSAPSSVPKNLKSTPFLPESTCAIICYVDLIKSDSDSAMFPYLVFRHIPNYVGFRKCFPNIQYIHLETKFLPEPYCMPQILSHRIIRTRVSIRLDQAITQLSDLPVDWCVTIDGPPDIDEADLSEVEWPWIFFVYLKTDLRDESCWDDYPEAKRFIWRRTFDKASTVLFHQDQTQNPGVRKEWGQLQLDLSDGTGHIWVLLKMSYEYMG
ncbi:hypothetical protein EDD85DRAFT_938507 [Armillaria nabsnona]|nr:hypothetical protein EDD85DRAFT_938507 [Armillaria nabsnona]